MTERGRSPGKGGKKGGGKGDGKSRSSSPRACFTCGSKDHLAASCPNKPSVRPGSPPAARNTAESKERKSKIPCFNQRPWDDPPVACGFLHAASKPEGHVYRKPSPRGKSRGKKKVRRKPAQLFMATLGQMAVANAAISAVAAPTGASSLSLLGSMGQVQWDNGIVSGLLRADDK